MNTVSQKTQIIIDERLALLPDTVTDLLTSGYTRAVVDWLGTKYELSTEQQLLLAAEIDATILLLLPLYTLPARIAESLTAEKTTAAAIARDAEEIILWRVRVIHDQLTLDQKVRRDTVGDVEPQQALRELAADIEAEHIVREDGVPKTSKDDITRGYSAYREQYRYGEEPEKTTTEKTTVSTSQADILSPVETTPQTDVRKITPVIENTGDKAPDQSA